MEYEIKIKGYLDTKWADWFDSMQIIHNNDDTTTLCGDIPDQAALQGILKNITNINLELISVKQVKLDEQDETLAHSDGGSNTN